MTSFSKRVEAGLWRERSAQSYSPGRCLLKLDGLIGSINDPILKAGLQGIERNFEGSIIGVLSPGPSDGSFTGGISIAGGTLT